MGRSFRAVVLAASLTVGAPVAALAENLADALVGAYQTSGLLGQNRALLRAADEDVAIAVAALRPVVDFVLGTSRSLTNSRTAAGVIDSNTSALTLTLSASWLLWDNGRSQFATQAARETVLATRSALQSVEQQILLRAVQAYLALIRESEFVALRENNIRLLTQELRAAQDRFDLGEVTRTDVALAEARLAEARANLATAQGNFINAQQEYLTAVGRQVSSVAPPPPLPARPANIEAIKTNALRNHPDIRQAQYQVSAAELAVLAAEAGMGPALRLSADLSSAESSNNIADRDAVSMSLNLSQRLYQGGAIAANLRRTMAQRDAARSALLNVQEAIAQAAAAALVRFEVAQATIEANDRRIAAAQVAFNGVREEASLGARTTLDVLDAEQELLDAQAARIAAQSELYVAAYQILAAQGLLTASNLKLPVQIYDAEAYFNQVKTAPAFRSQQGQQLDRVLRKIAKD